jgi:hypothetical protein
MALDIENLGSTGVAVVETRVDRTTVNPALNGVPELVPSGQVGFHGLHIITGTTEHSGKFCRIRFITGTQFTTLEGHNLGGPWTTVTFPAGSELVGYFTKVKLASGSVVLTHA